MARIKPIRIRQNDKAEYERLVRNARAKIRRTQKKHGVDLSGEIQLPKIDEFRTRDEFNEWKEQAESFTNRYNLRYQFVTNEYGVTASKSRINRIQRLRKREQQVAKEQYEKVKDRMVKQGGVPFATVEQRTQHFSGPSVTGVSIPKDFEFKKIRSKSKLDEIEEVGERSQYPEHYDERKLKMKESFVDSLQSAFNNEADDLVKLINGLSPDEFYYLYLENEEFAFEDFYYEADEIVSSRGHVNKMKDILRNFLDNTRKDDLKFM